MKRIALFSILAIMLIPLLALTQYGTSDTIIVTSQSFSEKESNFATETLRFESKDLEVKIKISDARLVSIEAPKGSFTKDQLSLLMETVNKQANASAAAPCPCAWWDVPCLAYCALCEALGGCDDNPTIN